MKAFTTTSVEQMYKKIREERLKQGLTQQEVATRAGIAVRTVSVIETGNCTPHLSKILAVIEALGYDVLAIKV